jgi:hypothetical protein
MFVIHLTELIPSVYKITHFFRKSQNKVCAGLGWDSQELMNFGKG